MERRGHLRGPDEVWIRARERKLLVWEIAIARSKGWTTMLFPCKNHMHSDLRATLTLNNYEACLKKNG